MNTEAAIIEAVGREFTGACRYVRPPYGRRIAHDLELLATRASAGTTLAVLVPARMDTRWWWNHCRPWEIRFLRGRVKLDGHRSGCPFPSALIVMGPQARAGETWWWELS